MDKFLYYIIKIVLQVLMYLLSPFLYAFSNLLKFVLFDVFSYRKRVIVSNLSNSFPDKSPIEINQIANRFYFYFCDLMFETLQTLILPGSVIKQKCELTNEAKQLLNNYYSNNKSIIIVMGHWGNWEWGGSAFSSECKLKLNVIYHPLQNKAFNHLIRFMRMRYGTGLIAMSDAFRDMVKNRNTTTATAFIADQSPPPEGAHWLTFLNQDTPFFRGPETISKKMDLPVIYVSINRIKRGKYLLNAEVLVEKPKETDNGFITEQFAKRLEQDIITQPEIWLWSHKRWKHKR